MLHLLFTGADIDSDVFFHFFYLHVSENSIAPPGVIGENVFIVTIANAMTLRCHSVLNLKLKLMQAGVEVGLDGPRRRDYL